MKKAKIVGLKIQLKMPKAKWKDSWIPQGLIHLLVKLKGKKNLSLKVYQDHFRLIKMT